MGRWRRIWLGMVSFLCKQIGTSICCWLFHKNLGVEKSWWRIIMFFCCWLLRVYCTANIDQCCGRQVTCAKCDITRRVDICWHPRNGAQISQREIRHQWQIQHFESILQISNLWWPNCEMSLVQGGQEFGLFRGWGICKWTVVGVWVWLFLTRVWSSGCVKTIATENGGQCMSENCGDKSATRHETIEFLRWNLSLHLETVSKIKTRLHVKSWK